MRTISVSLILLLLPTPASADDTRVTVLDPHVTLIRSDGHVEALCGASRVGACTRFVAYRLEATCSTMDGSSRMTATARFQPWIFLRDLAALTHEKEHVEDVRASLERYIARLEGIEFGGTADCQQAALRETGEFRIVVESSARASAVLRDAPQGTRMASRR